MYKVFNSFMEYYTESIRDARQVATLNAAAVLDMSTDLIIVDYRTAESESDEKG